LYPETFRNNWQEYFCKQRLKNMAKKRRRKKADEMSFLEHLEELRWHLIRSTIVIFLMAIVAFVFHNFIFDNIILAPKSAGFFTNRLLCRLGDLVHVSKLCINTKPLEIININMAGQFTTHIMVSLIVGLIAGFPYVFFEFWKFMKPALYENEKKYARGSVFYSSLLFFLGVLFGYYIIAPLSINFLGSYSVSGQIINRINLRSYISTVTTVTLAGGITFELPVLVYFLTKAGLVTPDFLKRYRKHAIVIILILAAIITPPDIFSQILVFIPLVVLYEVSILISKKIKRQQDAAFEEKGYGKSESTQEEAEVSAQDQESSEAETAPEREQTSEKYTPEEGSASGAEQTGEGKTPDEPEDSEGDDQPEKSV